MIRLTELRLPLSHPPEDLNPAVLARLQLNADQVRSIEVFKRSWDARRRGAIVLIYTLDVTLVSTEEDAACLSRFAGDPHVKRSPDTRYQFVGMAAEHWGEEARAGHTPRPVVVGFGPCGLFAALVLAQMGLAPLVLERGKPVRERTKDTWGLWRKGVLDPGSNVQFGEGGAGTFSDGKLWSQISDPRHLTRKVLTEFVKAGAPEEILYVAKPHIGTFRLVSMIEKMRAEIERLGGEIRFEQHVTDLWLEGPKNQRCVRGVVLASGEQVSSEHVVLAIGHSARDTFAWLHERGVFLEPKPFSVGFRIEHPQRVIDRARFGAQAGHPILGAADYKLVHHARNGRSAYSFCMCPGGTVVAATSETERVVTNGMSQYSRNERNANAGIVVGIQPSDYRQDGRVGDTATPVSPLDGMAFQRQWESRAYELGGGGYQAPGQLVGDFILGRHGASVTREFGTVLPSYKPGVHLTDLADPAKPSLPPYVLEAIREALPAWDSRLLHGRRRIDRRGNAHLIPVAHHARQRPPKPQCPGSVPCR
jgi:uncharacterized protein